MIIKQYLKYLNDYCPVGDGWKPLLIQLCKDILNITPNIEILQVKEKFGGLRFYIGGVDSNKADKIFNLIDIAEKESYKICEHCGTKENVETKGSWILTLCKKCRKTRR